MRAPAVKSTMVVGVVAMAVVMGGVALYCHLLLRDATAGGGAEVSDLFLPFAAILVVAGLVGIVFQSLHVAHRVAGPEYRLAQALRRMQRGDLSFRIHLRRGDLLGPLAQECNELLDRLNENPPPGAEVGSDVVSVHTGELAAESLADFSAGASE